MTRNDRKWWYIAMFPFIKPRMDFALILLISDMMIYTSLTSPTLFLSALSVLLVDALCCINSLPASVPHYVHFFIPLAGTLFLLTCLLVCGCLCTTMLLSEFGVAKFLVLDIRVVCKQGCQCSGIHCTKGLWAHNANIVKIHIAFTWKIKTQSGHNFAHVITVQLSWHVQTCDLVGSLESILG